MFVPGKWSLGGKNGDDGDDNGDGGDDGDDWEVFSGGKNNLL